MNKRPRARTTRDPNAPKVTEGNIQPWDLQVFRELQEHRLLNTSQLLALTDRTRRPAQDRLKKLWNGGFIERISGKSAEEHQKNPDFIYALDKRGAKMLIDRGEYARPKLEARRKSGRVHINHTLLTADFLIRIKLACRESRGRVRYIPRDELLAGNARLERNLDKQLSIMAPVSTSYGTEDRSTVADGLFALDFTKFNRPPRVFFLEIDRGTMPVARSDKSKARNTGREQTELLRKFEVYYSYWREGRKKGLTPKCQEEFGFKDYGVLLLTDRNEQRVRNAIAEVRSIHSERDGSYPGFRQWFFGHTEHILDPRHDILRVSWMRGDGEPASLTPHSPRPERAPASQGELTLNGVR